MKLSKLLILLFLISPPISAAHSADQESDDEIYQYIKLFDGDFPIPIRFELISWNDRSLEYSSPAPLSRHGSTELSTEMPKVGYITIGTRKDLSREIGDSLVTPIATCGSLKVSRVTPREVPENLKNKFPQLILITGKNHYLTITDINIDLWRELIQLFAKQMKVATPACPI